MAYQHYHPYALSENFRNDLDEEFYNNQLNDPNFNLDDWILREQRPMDELEFTNIELTLLQEKFTHKYKNQHNSSYDQELAKMHENSKNCSICMLDYQNEDLCIDLPGCKHPHHFQCIKAWLEKKPNCPICRSNVRLGMIRELHNKVLLKINNSLRIFYKLKYERKIKDLCKNVQKSFNRSFSIILLHSFCRIFLKFEAFSYKIRLC